MGLSVVSVRVWLETAVRKSKTVWGSAKLPCLRIFNRLWPRFRAWHAAQKLGLFATIAKYSTTAVSSMSTCYDAAFE